MSRKPYGRPRSRAASRAILARLPPDHAQRCRRGERRAEAVSQSDSRPVLRTLDVRTPGARPRAARSSPPAAVVRPAKHVPFARRHAPEFVARGFAARQRDNRSSNRPGPDRLLPRVIRRRDQWNFSCRTGERDWVCRRRKARALTSARGAAPTRLDPPCFRWALNRRSSEPSWSIVLTTAWIPAA